MCTLPLTVYLTERGCDKSVLQSTRVVFPSSRSAMILPSSDQADLTLLTADTFSKRFEFFSVRSSRITTDLPLSFLRRRIVCIFVIREVNLQMTTRFPSPRNAPRRCAISMSDICTDIPRSFRRMLITLAAVSSADSLRLESSMP